MMYAGKTLDQMTGNELEAAAVACNASAEQAREVYAQSQAAPAELAEECAKRLQNAKKMN